ncbi:hypothetical protein MASR2M54_06080 [Aliarcobacter cryaerophilus]
MTECLKERIQNLKLLYKNEAYKDADYNYCTPTDYDRTTNYL